MWAQIISAALGIWLMASPSILNYTGGAAAIDHRIVGPLVVSFAVIAWWEITRPARWVNLPLGLWLIISPLVFRFDDTESINSIVVGVLVALLTLVRGTYRTERFGGGWLSLWHPDVLEAQISSSGRNSRNSRKQ